MMPPRAGTQTAPPGGVTVWAGRRPFCFTRSRGYRGAYDRIQELHITSAPRKSGNLALPDVTLRLDLRGVIRGANLANSLSGEATESWVGRSWTETVNDPGGCDIMTMLAAAMARGVSDFRRVVQLFPSGSELPVEYMVVRLGDRTGLTAIGRHVYAASTQARLPTPQPPCEQDSWKLRAAETRKRLLFEASDDPILLLRGDDLSIVEANPAAIRAGALNAGRDFLSVVAPSDRQPLRTMLAQVTQQRRVLGILVHIGATDAPWVVRAQHAAGQEDTMFLVRLSPAAPPVATAHAAPTVEHLVEHLPEGFAVIDHTGTIHRANRAFHDLVQCAVAGSVVSNFATSLRGEHGTESEARIAAAAYRDSDAAHIALSVSDLCRRKPAPAISAQTGAPHDSLLTKLTELTTEIGAVPLLQLVRDAGALIEQHCIETALKRARGNRTVTARLLGLSRQSLYAKLSRYGIGQEPTATAPGE